MKTEVFTQSRGRRVKVVNRRTLFVSEQIADRVEAIDGQAALLFCRTVDGDGVKAPYDIREYAWLFRGDAPSLWMMRLHAVPDAWRNLWHRELSVFE